MDPSIPLGYLVGFLDSKLRLDWMLWSPVSKTCCTTVSPDAPRSFCRKQRNFSTRKALRKHRLQMIAVIPGVELWWSLRSLPISASFSEPIVAHRATSWDHGLCCRNFRAVQEPSLRICPQCCRGWLLLLLGCSQGGCTLVNICNNCLVVIANSGL